MIPQLQAFSIKDVLSLKICCFGAQNACLWKGTIVAWRHIHHSKFIQFWEKIVNDELHLILFYNIKVREKIHNKYKVSWKILIIVDNVFKGLKFCLLSHNCHFDMDRNVSTAHCRSSSGNSVHLLSWTICTGKNPKFGKVRQVPTREFPTKFPDWDLSHSSKFGIFVGIL